jgi:hypothetical protein
MPRSANAAVAVEAVAAETGRVAGVEEAAVEVEGAAGARKGVTRTTLREVACLTPPVGMSLKRQVHLGAPMRVALRVEYLVGHLARRLEGQVVHLRDPWPAMP